MLINRKLDVKITCAKDIKCPCQGHFTSNLLTNVSINRNVKISVGFSNRVEMGAKTRHHLQAEAHLLAYLWWWGSTHTGRVFRLLQCMRRWAPAQSSHLETAEMHSLIERKRTLIRFLNFLSLFLFCNSSRERKHKLKLRKRSLKSEK